MVIAIPEHNLLILIGASGSGTLTCRPSKPTGILSSNACRGWVTDDDRNQEATGYEFETQKVFVRG